MQEGRDFPKHHKIWDLWSMAKKITIKVFENENESPDLDSAEHVIREFSNIDYDSLAFRYPTTKDGNTTIKDEVKHINIRRLAKHIERLSNDLEGISAGISDCRDLQR